MAGTTVIKRIELINFMSHAHSVIEPAAGLTVLIGPNNCGKSAFVRALQILCHNAPSGFVLRHGEQKCEVKVETTDGHEIIWSRTKNGAGTYLIDGKRFDRLRGSVPEEVHQILKMPKVQCDPEPFDIHFGEQSEPVFLLKNRGKASAQFFASSSDATHLVAMQTLHRSKLSQAKSDHRRLVEQKEVLERRLTGLQPVPELSQRLEQLETDYEQLQSRRQQTQQFEQLLGAMEEQRRRAARCEARLACLEPLSLPPVIDDLQPLIQLNQSMGQSLRHVRHLDGCLGYLELLQLPPRWVPTDPLEQMVGGIRKADARSAQLTRQLETLIELAPAPVLNPVEPLVDLVQRIGREEARLSEASQMADRLRVLENPPKPADDQQLDSLVVRFRQLEHQLAIADRQSRALCHLASPPQPDDWQSLQVLNTEMARLCDQVRDRERQIENTEAAIDAVIEQLQAWCVANPECPTCGAPTEVQHMLGGEHA